MGSVITQARGFPRSSAKVRNKGFFKKTPSFTDILGLKSRKIDHTILTRWHQLGLFPHSL
jgi:hypothetical protein